MWFWLSDVFSVKEQLSVSLGSITKVLRIVYKHAPKGYYISTISSHPS